MGEAVVRTDRWHVVNEPLHPAAFSRELMPWFVKIVEDYDNTVKRSPTRPVRILDPFAGTGRIHQLMEIENVQTYGVEIEPEWAELHPLTNCADSTNMDYFLSLFFDMIVTSPTYGNRFSDKHTPRNEAREWTRRSYAYDLRKMTGDPNRRLAPSNTGQFPFSSPKYKSLHRAVYAECYRVLRFGGWFVLNISDHIRADKVIPVATWHRDALIDLGFTVVTEYDIPTPRLRMGRNEKARVPFEKIYVLEK